MTANLPNQLSKSKHAQWPGLKRAPISQGMPHIDGLADTIMPRTCQPLCRPVSHWRHCGTWVCPGSASCYSSTLWKSSPASPSLGLVRPPRVLRSSRRRHHLHVNACNEIKRTAAHQKRQWGLCLGQWGYLGGRCLEIYTQCHCDWMAVNGLIC